VFKIEFIVLAYSTGSDQLTCPVRYELLTMFILKGSNF